MECFCGPARTLACRIVLLDECELLHEIQDNNTGQALLDVVFRHLDLLETAYFGLRYVDHENQTHWLESAKRLRRQLRGADPHTLYFGVKYYAADPCKLLEEITRYQLFLQVKQDVVRGRLPLDFELAAELAAYVLQSELGDYEPRRHQAGYVAEFRLVPRQTRELEARAADLHRTLTGVTPAEAELSYLSKVKWLDMYGVDLHPVLGEDSSAYFLGVAPSALLVVRGRAAVAAYYWPRVARLHHKGRYFMLRVADNNNSSSTYGFETSSRSACRHLWRCCSDQLAFFRLQQVSPAAADIFALTARLRHSGRASATATRPRAPPAFTRAPSRRYSRTPDAAELNKTDEPQTELQPPSATQVPRPASMEGGSSAWSGTGPTGSPRSTRSAPTRRGLYYAEAPHAARPPPAPRRSASVESHSSNDSRSTRKHRHRSRRASDAESEASRGSGRRRRHRRGRHVRDSASDTDSRRRRSASDHGGEYELVEGAVRAGGSAQVASVRRASHRHRKHRKHRSRSGSPPDKSWLPSELKQHLEFELVDTTGMSEAQRREIPYTVVCTGQGTQARFRHSTRHKQISEEHVTGETERVADFGVAPVLQDKSLAKHSLIRMANGNTSNRISVDRYEQTAWKRKTGSGLHGPVAPRAYAAHSTSSSGELVSARVSHEHTDSGLGADQDYAYSSERSSDSAKLGASKCGEHAGEGGATCAVSSHWPSADLAALSLRRRPPAGPRARVGGSLRSLASVQSEGRPARRVAASPVYTHDSGLSIHTTGQLKDECLNADTDVTPPKVAEAATPDRSEMSTEL